MSAFQRYRIAHEYVQTNPGPPERVFPLLCPVRERDWLPGWKYRLIYSDSGVAELGCVFTTPNARSSAPSQLASETTWIVTEYDPAALRIAFVWVNPGKIIAELRIQLTSAEPGVTRTHIRYRYTGLSEEGNRELAGYDRKRFEARLQNWETMINHYLRTGEKLSAPAGG